MCFTKKINEKVNKQMENWGFGIWNSDNFNFGPEIPQKLDSSQYLDTKLGETPNLYTYFEVSFFLISSMFAGSMAFKTWWGQAYLLYHGLPTPNEGINQRSLKNWADVADKI